MHVPEKGQNSGCYQDNTSNYTRTVFQPAPIAIEVFHTLVYQIDRDQHSGQRDDHAQQRQARGRYGAVVPGHDIESFYFQTGTEEHRHHDDVELLAHTFLWAI